MGDVGPGPQTGEGDHHVPWNPGFRSDRRIALEGPDDEITRLAATFDGMLERLDRAFSSQRRFLADTSHDLRAPLAVIRSNVELSPMTRGPP